MKRLIGVSILFLAVGSLFLLNPSHSNEVSSMTKVETKQVVQPNKKFVIKVEKGINNALLNDENIYVLDKNIKKIKVGINKVNEKEITIAPPTGGYKKGDLYQLNIDGDLYLEKANNKKLPDDYIIPFTVE